MQLNKEGRVMESTAGESMGRPQIYRVPMQLQLRLKKKQQYVYEPMMVAIGPYHHGKPHLLQMEDFKRCIVTNFLFALRAGVGMMEMFHRKILERINDIRNCYVGVTITVFQDTALADMIFHDTCFIVYYMQVAMGNQEMQLHFLQYLGPWMGALIHPDLIKVENQIPYWVVKHLIVLLYGEAVGKDLLCKFLLSNANFGKVYRKVQIPWEDEVGGEEPLHLLEAFQRILGLQEHEQDQEYESKTKEQEQELSQGSTGMSKSSRIWNGWRKEEDDADGLNREIVFMKTLSHQFYSATDLIKKGIHFKPSSTCLKDIKFISSAFYGQLQLPVWFVSSKNYVYLRNMIAFEMSAGTNKKLVMTSYVNLMKTLIESPNDVKELRQMDILFSDLGSDEEVVKLFQDIDTMGVGLDLLYQLKDGIQKHCNSKRKTWMAELSYNYFRSPWTVIALLAATFLLILTFLQTYFTIIAA